MTQVPPFPIEGEYPTEIEGTHLETDIDWMRTCSYITVTTHPAISVPAGFTSDGLPLVGRHRADRAVPELASTWEEGTNWEARVQPLYE